MKIMLKANGRCGVPQGGVLSPLLSNVYLTEVDRMLERAKARTPDRAQLRAGAQYGGFALKDDEAPLSVELEREAALSKKIRALEVRLDARSEIWQVLARVVDNCEAFLRSAKPPLREHTPIEPKPQRGETPAASNCQRGSRPCQQYRLRSFHPKDQGHEARCHLPVPAARRGNHPNSEKIIAAMKGLEFDSPRGVVKIDPETRDIVQTIYFRKVEKVGGELYNIEFDKIDNVKDPGK